jgi:hypothetical protein
MDFVKFYLQHGYGKSGKIQSIGRAGKLGGVILSPADEDPTNLEITANMCRVQGLDVRIDPQMYIYTTAPRGVGRNHDAHGIEMSGVHWSQDAKSTARQIQAVGRLNSLYNANGAWIAPSVLQSSFTDVWTPVALQLARTASDAWGPDRTIATLVIDEGALSTWAAIDDWLDVATTLNVRGFYILVDRGNSSWPPVAWSHERLTNLLRLIHNLSVVNKYEVSWGYSDAEGLLGLAAGADSIASGWTFGLRQFNASKWQPTEAGPRRAPLVRYNVRRLWSSLRVNEAMDLYRSDLREQVFSAREIEEIERRPVEEYSRAEAQEQHLGVLAERTWSLSKKEAPQRPEAISKSLQRGIDLHQQIRAEGFVLESRYLSRLLALETAFSAFRNSEGL